MGFAACGQTRDEDVARDKVKVDCRTSYIEITLPLCYTITTTHVAQRASYHLCRIEASSGRTESRKEKPTMDARSKFIALVLAALVLSACGVLQAPPTATPVPPTATPIPPTATPVPPTATPIPGIEAPLTIARARLLVTSVEIQDSFELGPSQRFEPTSHNDAVLVVETKTENATEGLADDWEVSVTDENGRRSEPAITMTSVSQSGSVESITWVLIVARASRSFTLHLPEGQTVDLAHFLR